jgi:hypothetical protein
MMKDILKAESLSNIEGEAIYTLGSIHGRQCDVTDKILIRAGILR